MRTHWRIRLVVQNTGWLPSYVSKRALERKVVRGVIAEIALPPGAALVHGKRREDLGQLEGKAYKHTGVSFWPDYNVTDDRTKIEWVVRARKGDRVDLVARHERAGTVRASVVLAEPCNAGPDVAAPRGYLYYRHTLPVRVMHWINVVALTILLMSGLQIFNAHPALYWGKSSYTGRPPLLEMQRARAARRPARRRHPRSSARNSTRPGSSACRMERDGAAVRARLPVVDHDSRQPRGCRWRAPGISSSRGCSWSTASRTSLYSVASRHLARDLAPDRGDLRSIGAVDPRSPALPPSDRRGGEALQRAAEARLSRRDLRAAAAHRADGSGDVAVARTRCSPAGSTSSAAGSRRARSISSPRGCWSPSCGPRVRGRSSPASGTTCAR